MQGNCWIFSVLQLEGNEQLADYVAAHVIDAHATRHVVHVGVFQSAEVTLIGLIRQVAGSEDQGADRAAAMLDVGARLQVEQRVVRCGGLCVVGHVVMVL